MSFLDDMGQILVNESLGILNTNIFLGDRPETPDDVITLYEYAGTAPSFVGQTRSPGLQVTVRSEDYETGRTTIQTIYDFLDQIGDEQREDYAEGIEANGNWYLRFAPVQEPFPTGKDEKGRQTFIQNFIVTHRRD